MFFLVKHVSSRKYFRNNEAIKFYKIEPKAGLDYRVHSSNFLLMDMEACAFVYCNVKPLFSVESPSPYSTIRGNVFVITKLGKQQQRVPGSVSFTVSVVVYSYPTFKSLRVHNTVWSSL